jgi:hypothetical protein
VRSPLFNIDKACQTCHRTSEDELRDRVHIIQERTYQLRNLALDAVLQLTRAITPMKSDSGNPRVRAAQGFQRKAQFLTSIPLALKNLRWFIEHHSLGISVPEFKRVLDLCVDEEIIQRFTPVQANEQTPLVVSICSFSFRNGPPPDTSGNGGGFVFDVRSIDNPGRHEEYKSVHGRDKPVMEYLERQTRMQDYLNSVFDIIDISVEEYIRRDFTHLSVSFGCTGGQHRSVYAADALAKHLRNKYRVKIDLQHLVQEARGWKNGVVAVS